MRVNAMIAVGCLAATGGLLLAEQGYLRAAEMCDSRALREGNRRMEATYEAAPAELRQSANHALRGLPQNCRTPFLYLFADDARPVPTVSSTRRHEQPR